MTERLPTNIHLTPDFLSPEVADSLLRELITDIPWQQDRIRLYGREHPIPRMHQWHADAGVEYSWSGLTMQPRDWLPQLATLRDRLTDECDIRFNSVLANLYRDGNDSMGWHADDESELGSAPVIASISLGAARDFQLRRKDGRGETLTVKLSHGSLLIMRDDSQAVYQHALPKRKRVTEPRINLTFRQVFT